MNNRIFMKKSIKDKRRYLKALLRSSAGGSLDKEMIAAVLSKISIHRQYAVNVFSEKPRFWRAVNGCLFEKGTVTVAHTPGNSSQGKMAVIVTIPGSAYDRPIRPIRAIFVYSPKRCKNRGMKKWTLVQERIWS